MTIDCLKRETGVTDYQLNAAVEEEDIITLAPHFDNVDNYELSLLNLPAQRVDVRRRTFEHGNEAGMKLALNFWHDKNPLEATFRALLFILLSLNKGILAIKVCKYLSDKCELHVIACL